MTHGADSCGGLAVMGRGECDKPEPELFEAEIRKTVRYADPAAWVAAGAAARAVAPVEDGLAALRDQVGVIVISDEGPSEALAVVAEAAVAGFSSPLRYPAANPGSLAGVTCIAFGFRGPSLNFIMPPARGVPPGLVVANGWLWRRVVPYVVLAVCGHRVSGELLGRCLLLSAADLSRASGVRIGEEDIAWLTPNFDSRGLVLS